MCAVKPQRFVGLHAHTVASAYDCVGSADDHIDFVLENEMDAWAMTDHGNMNSLPHAFMKNEDLKKQGRAFKAIYGCEFYLHPDLAEWRLAKAEAEQAKAIKKTKGAAVTLAAGLSLTGDDAVEGTDGVENEAASKTNKWLNPVNRRHHLVVLAKTSRGLKNLFTLVSRSSKEGFYKFPRIDYRMLKEHGEDLIVSTACCAGNLAFDVVSSYPDIPWDDLGPIEAGVARDVEVQAKLKNSLGRLVDAVGQQNVFVEIQFNALKPQHLINRHLMKLAKDEGMPLIATADSHYCRPDYWQSREIYKKLGWLNYEKYDPSLIPQSVDELKCELYPKNASQMWDSYKKYGAGFDFYDDQTVCDAIERTHDIAHQMIGDVSPDRSVKLPAFVVPKGRDEHDVLVEFCREGMVRLGLDGRPEYEARLIHELDVIKLREADRYFLTMKAVIDIAWEHMLVGPGRGSSAASLVCYCLNITQLDPLKYGLLFERFLAPARKELPDVDSDVADRDGLVTLLKERFGNDNVIPISNFNTFKLNSLVRDLSRFYGLPHDEVNRVMKQADAEVRRKVLVKGTDKNTYEMTLEQALEHSTVFSEFTKQHQELGQHINVLLKQNKTIGRHAGGVLICDRILERMPVIRVRGELQTPWVEGVTDKMLHEFGWCKFDLLGLDTLRIIQRTIERIIEDQTGQRSAFAAVKAWYDEHLHPSKLDLDDQHVYDYVYRQGSYAGIFQVTSPGSKRLFKQGKPTNIVDIAALTSIFRPGPLAIDADKAYIKAKNDPASVVYDHPLIEEVLGGTYGLLVFQEQLLKLGSKVGGMSPVDCDRLRKAFGKKQAAASAEKKRQEEIVELRTLFVAGATSRGFTEEKALKLFQDMGHQSGYAFNLPHAVSYALVSYACSYLLVHHQEQWLCAYLESQITDPGKRANAMSELQSFGYTIDDVDVNLSTDRWQILPGKRFLPSLQTCKGIGGAAIEEMMANRPYKGIEDLLWKEDGTKRHSKFNKRALEALIKVGGFGSMDLVGPDKLFESYRHMHAVLVERGDEIRHPKHGRDAFWRILEEARGMPPWDRKQLIEDRLELMGYFDASAALTPAMRDKLKRLDVTSIDEHQGDVGIHWFVTVGAMNKTTRNGKPYKMLKVAGASGDTSNMFYWGSNHGTVVPMYVACVAEVRKDDWGYSTDVKKLKFLER